MAQAPRPITAARAAYQIADARASRGLDWQATVMDEVSAVEHDRWEGATWERERQAMVTASQRYRAAQRRYQAAVLEPARARWAWANRGRPARASKRAA
jgi:hypothetical protein